MTTLERIEFSAAPKRMSCREGEIVTTLQEAIVAFTEHHSRYQMAVGAVGQCNSASYTFVQFCRDNGIGGVDEYEFYTDNVAGGWHTGRIHGPNPDPSLFQYKMHETLGKYTSRYHCIVQTDKLFIDFTVKQYDPNAISPWTKTREKAAAVAGGN